MFSPVLIGIIVAGIIALIVFFKLIWRVADANEALIISGLGASSENGAGESLNFKIVVGRGTTVVPGFQKVRRLALDTRGTTLQVSCVTSEAISVNIRAVVAYKVGDDTASIANAARRWLDQQGDPMQATIHELFAGHLRAAVGGVTITDLLHNREALTGEVRSTLAVDLQRLGLVVDSLQLQEIDDTVGYIENLGRPEAAKVAAAARIADAERNKEATKAEQEAAAETAAYTRDSEIRQAEARAATQAKQAEAAQAGPLAEAVARQEVVKASTATAQMEAALTEQRLESEVRKPADAQAYQMQKLAEGEAASNLARARALAEATKISGVAEADATKAKGLAAAEAAKAKGLAEAAAIEARAKALATESKAVIAQQIAERYPEIVAAAAGAFQNVDNMVVLNGADGMEDMLGKVLTMGGAGFGIAKSLIDSLSGDNDKETVNGAVVDSNVAALAAVDGSAADA